MVKKPKTKKMTLESLSVAIQQDFSALRNDMAGGFRAIREEMATKEDLAAVSDRISVAKDELQEQIAGLRYAKEIDELRARVKLVERKLGIAEGRRAA